MPDKRPRRRPNGEEDSATRLARARRLRELRQASGLTQAELAGAELTKGYISLVETGRAQLSLRAARTLARRLHIEVGDLVAPTTDDEHEVELALLRADQRVRSEAFDEARAIVSEWGPRAGGVLRGRFRRLEAHILIEAGSADEVAGASALLQQAHDIFRRHQRPELIARTLFDLARASLRRAAYSEALSYAFQAEQIILRGEVIDRTLELEIHQLLIAAYVQMGDLVSAAQRGKQAQSLAEDIGDPHTLVALYEELAMARQGAGDLEAAVGYARKALELRVHLDQREQIARMWNTIGCLHIKQGDHQKARAALDRADQLAARYGVPTLARSTAINRAEIALAEGRAQEARDIAARLKADIGEDAAWPLRQRVLLTHARALAATEAPLDAVRSAFEEVLAVAHGAAGRCRTAAYRAYAEALAARGQLTDALTQMEQALGNSLR